MNNNILLTKEGEKKLRDELKHLINVVRPEVIEELKEARAQGDLSENADYDAARNRQAEVEGRIREIEESLNHMIIIRESHSKTTQIIKLGSEVVYARMDNRIKLFNQTNKIRIVGPVEANPFSGLVSNESPIAKAVIGKTIGDIVEVKTPKLAYKLKIIKIS